MVGAWVLAQVADLVTDAFNSPDWVIQMIITLLVIGLPVSLLLSWAFDLTSDGLLRTGSGAGEGTLVVGSKSILALVAGLFLVLAVALFLFWPRGDRSIAVLPFDDVSPDGSQAYLGKGIAVEIRLRLQELEGLRVAGETSSNAYATEDSRTIGEALDVGTILEGNVRQDGSRVRITWQLINAADGFTVTSGSYDRDLEQIFEMQTQIAASVAGYLGVSLGVGGVNAFSGAGTESLDAYEAYLQARELGNGSAAIPLLERATQIDPNYGVAWSRLALSLMSRWWVVNPEEIPELAERAYQHALRGVELSPESAESQSALAIAQMLQFDWIGAEQAHTLATDLLADRSTLGRYAVTQLRTGRVEEAKAKFRLAESIEPMGGLPLGLSWHASLAQGLVDEAREFRMRNMGLDFFEDNLDLAFNEDDPAAMIEAIRGLPETSPAYVHLFGPLLADFDSPERILALLQGVYEDEELIWPRKLHDIAMAAAYFGHPRFSLQVKKVDIQTNPSRIVAIWYPVMSEVRQLTEFNEFVTELNMVEYWKSYTWPDVCRPLDDKNFTCS